MRYYAIWCDLDGNVLGIVYADYMYELQDEIRNAGWIIEPGEMIKFEKVNK